MESVAAVCDLYQRELHEAVATLRHRGLISSGRSQQSTRSTHSSSRRSRYHLGETTQSFIETMRETGDIRTPHKAVLDVLVWGSVLIFFSHIGSRFGSHAANPFLSLIFDKFGATLFAYVVLPVLTNMTIKQIYKFAKRTHRAIDDTTIRLVLLASALMQGIISGYVIDSTYLSSEPLAFVTPLAIALAYGGEVKSLYRNRLALLIACMAAGLSANLLFGKLMDNITKTYEIMSIAYCAAGMVTMQFVFKNIRKSGTGHYEQYFLLQSFTLIRALAFLICGYYRTEHSFSLNLEL